MAVMGLNAILGKISFYWQYPFVRYALVVGVLIALCSSLLGVTLVLRRFSFIGDGLSHVAFGAMTIATVLKMTEKMPLIMGITIVSAVLLLRTGQNTKIKGDAMMAMISVGALAIGYLIMNLFSTAANLSGDVCSTLFGSTSILTLTKGEVWFCAAMSAIVVVIFILFYNKIFAITFDEDFSRTAGTKAGFYNLMLAIIIAVVIVLAMNLSAHLLISALVFSSSFGNVYFKNFPQCYDMRCGIVCYLCGDWYSCFCFGRPHQLDPQLWRFKLLYFLYFESVENLQEAEWHEKKKICDTWCDGSFFLNGLQYTRYKSDTARALK